MTTLNNKYIKIRKQCNLNCSTNCKQKKTTYLLDMMVFVILFCYFFFNVFCMCNCRTYAENWLSGCLYESHQSRDTRRQVTAQCS